MAARAFINLGTFGSFQGHEVPALISNLYNDIKYKLISRLNFTFDFLVSQ